MRHQWVVPSLAELYGLQLEQMRVAEMFVRRYDSGVAGGRANHPVPDPHRSNLIA